MKSKQAGNIDVIFFIFLFIMVVIILAAVSYRNSTVNATSLAAFMKADPCYATELHKIGATAVAPIKNLNLSDITFKCRPIIELRQQQEVINK